MASAESVSLGHTLNVLQDESNVGGEPEDSSVLYCVNESERIVSVRVASVCIVDYS